MKIIKNEYSVRCDIGRCANKATHSIVPNNVDKCSYINVCDDCLKELVKSVKEIAGKESGQVKKTMDKQIHINKTKGRKPSRSKKTIKEKYEKV